MWTEFRESAFFPLKFLRPGSDGFCFTQVFDKLSGRPSLGRPPFFPLQKPLHLLDRPLLGRQQAAAARQAAINDVRAKEHLAPVGGGQAAEDGLTDEIIRNYRQYNPRWTRAQIAAFHRSYKQGV